MLKLPDYETLEDMEKKLRVAVTCGGQGFEFTWNFCCLSIMVWLLTKFIKSAAILIEQKVNQILGTVRWLYPLFSKKNFYSQWHK